MLEVLLVIGCFLGGFVIGYNIILRVIQYKLNKSFISMLKEAEENIKNK